MISLSLPVRAASVSNLREHWRARHKRSKKHRNIVRLCWLADVRGPVPLPCVVTVTRVAPRPLDGHDNLRSALKAVVDELAAQLGLSSDADPRVSWDYAQQRDGVREYRVEVRIAARVMAEGRD